MFFQRLEDLRVDHDKSQIEIAAYLNMNRNVYWRYEKGVREIPAWAVIKLIREPHNEKTYDLFMGQIVKAWADSRVFSNNHWHLEEGPDELRSMHYVAGGHFYAIGKRVDVTL